MQWPSRGKPDIYQRGKWWIVRWYDPVEKRVHSLRTADEGFARRVHALMQDFR